MRGLKFSERKQQPNPTHLFPHLLARIPDSALKFLQFSPYLHQIAKIHGIIHPHLRNLEKKTEHVESGKLRLKTV